MIATRLIAYHPNGARIGVLPDPASLSGHMPVNGVSALTLSYFGTSDGAEVFATPVEVALEVSAGAGWIEPANARFLRMVRDRDQTDKSSLWKFSMPGYAHLLKGACVLAAKTPSEANTDKDGKRKFLSANAGTIVKTVLDEARALDPRVLEGLTIDFTTSRDSAGALWSKVITIYYAPGMGLETIIDNLAAQGVIDWELQGRTLRLFNPDTVLARKLPQVRIHDQDSEQAPIKGTLEGLRHLVLLQGDEGKLWTKENVSAPAPWGKSITFITQGGVSDEGTASTLIQAELDAGSRERVQYTRALTLTEHTPTPFVDYRPGDYIQAHDAGDKWASLRVFALGLGREGGIHKVTLTLGDLFEDALIRQAKRTKGIVGGSSADGGSGARPAPPEPGTRKPMAPAGLVMNSDHYFDARGVAHASVLAAYAPATAGVDGLGLTIQAHELFGRQVGSTEPFRMLTSVEGETATIGFSPLPVQTHWDFKVRAVAENGVPSDFSNTFRIELARDVTPPPPPSEPVLTTRLGTVTVTWDGLTDLGTPMPADFDYCEIEITNHSGTGFIAVGEVRLSTGLTQLVIADLPYNTATQVRLVAVDSSGNRSEPSVIATISTHPLVDTDLIETTVFDAMAQLETDLADGMTAVEQGITDVGVVANAAQTAAGAAQTTADTAVSNAAAAQSTATNAGTAAASAATAASAANAAALAAAGIAESKGEVIYQATAPTGSRANAANLWIRSSDNSPHRYDGSAWVKVTDQAAVDAAAAAGVAQTAANAAAADAAAADAKAVAAKAAADVADAKAAAAQAAAGTAQDAADAAMIAAGTKSNIYYSTAVATGTGGRVDDIWRQRNAANEIIGEWRWTGSAWVKVTLTNGVFSNLDAGLLTAGFVSADRIESRTITAAKIAANTITANEIAAYTITATEIAARTITAVKLVANTITANEIAALTITADEIKANAITADKILAGSITTVKLEADAINASRLDALAITSKHTITGATIQTTATALRGVKINGSGLFAYDSSGQQTVSIYSATGNATVTGKVQTGLGNNQVVMSDNIGRGRPGISFDTGSTAALEPRIQSLGVGSDGFPAGALVLTGRETTLNSSGRADLVLEHGGDFQLKQNWGTRSGLGVNSSGDYLNLIGRMSKTSHNRQMLYAGESSSWTNINPGAYHEWSFTYGTPPAVGTRVPLLVSNTSGAMVTNLADYSASGFTARTHNLQTAGTPGYNVHYVSVNK